MTQPSAKLRLGALIALVVGSMIGWAITAVGMLTLAFVFQTLANRKPELDSGVYAYAKAWRPLRAYAAQHLWTSLQRSD